MSNKIRLIEEFLIDFDGQLFVIPKLKDSDYELIYRDASGIRWNKEKAAFEAYEPSRWQHEKLFVQILMAVEREFGQLLIIASDTRWTNVSTSLRKEFENLSQR